MKSIKILTFTISGITVTQPVTQSNDFMNNLAKITLQLSDTEIGNPENKCMKTLAELVLYLNTDFPQEIIKLKSFDFKTLSQRETPQPKYLYRGERTVNWKETTSTFSRNLAGHNDFRDINWWITGQHLKLPLKNNYSLYHFLREALWGISILEDTQPNPDIEKSIAGLLQHYEFDTSFIDLTSDINIAANFAATGNEGDIGQILILPTANVEDKYFDLTQEFGKRPKTQSSFVLFGLLLVTGNLDLKSTHFTQTYGASWHQFKLTAADKLKFHNPKILSLEDDLIAPLIINWYETHIKKSNFLKSSTQEYFERKIANLKIL